MFESYTLRSILLILKLKIMNESILISLNEYNRLKEVEQNSDRVFLIQAQLNGDIPYMNTTIFESINERNNELINMFNSDKNRFCKTIDEYNSKISYLKNRNLLQRIFNIDNF